MNDGLKVEEEEDVIADSDLDVDAVVVVVAVHFHFHRSVACEVHYSAEKDCSWRCLYENKVDFDSVLAAQDCH